MLKMLKVALLVSTVSTIGNIVKADDDVATPINPATCKDLTTLMGFIAAANEKSPGAVEVSLINGEGEHAGDNKGKAQTAVKAFNIVKQANYGGDGILIMYFPSTGIAIVGVLEDKGTSACEPIKLKPEEFQAFKVLLGEPVA